VNGRHRKLLVHFSRFMVNRQTAFRRAAILETRFVSVDTSTGAKRLLATVKTTDTRRSTC
jgi:hypothetical protein